MVDVDARCSAICNECKINLPDGEVLVPTENLRKVPEYEKIGNIVKYGPMPNYE